MRLIIDGNAVLNIVFRSVLNKLNQTPGPVYNHTENGRVVSSRAADMFDEFFYSYVKNIVLMLNGKVTHIYFAFDMPNWRKKYVKWYFSRPENKDKSDWQYKQRPTDSESVDMRETFDAFLRYTDDEIIPKLKSIGGVKVIKIMECEGDDIIAVLCDCINDHIIVWSVDTDLIQLIRAFEGKSVILIAPKLGKGDRKVYVFDEFFDKVGDGDVINLLESNFDAYNPVDMIDMLVDYKGHVMIKVDPKVDMFVKILTGDKRSDNIPSVYTWKSKSGLNMSLTEKVARELYRRISEMGFDKESILSDISKADGKMLNVISAAIVDYYDLNKEDPIVVNSIKDNILLNNKLIMLNKDNIPKPVYESIKKEYESSADFGTFKLAEYEKVTNCYGTYRKNNKAYEDKTYL